MARKKTFLIGIWTLNLVGALGVAGIFFVRGLPSLSQTQPTPAPVLQEISPSPSIVAPSAPATETLPPTLSPPPTVHMLPTVTPNPRATRIVVDTPTPFVLETGLKSMVIGYSVEGRPLEMYKFGNGPSQRLIVAGIHGGYEWNTIALADELITHISENPDVVPRNVTLYILRALNPDGDARAHGIEGRANENYVDLNHNFPYHWKEEWNRDGCWNHLPLTGGTHAGSEPETIALMNFINLHHIDVMISYHSAAMGIFAGGLPPFAPSERLAEEINKVSSYQYPPLDTGCEYSGNLTDWASSLKGIPSVDIELRNHYDTDFKMNLRVLDVFLSWQR